MAMRDELFDRNVASEFQIVCPRYASKPSTTVFTEEHVALTLANPLYVGSQV